MPVNRARSALVAAALCTALASPGYAQTRLEDKNSEKVKLSRAEAAQYQALNTLVDAVIAGKEPAPADFTLSFRNHFIRSVSNVFVPYLLEIGSGRLSAFPVALYIRAVKKGPATSATSQTAFTDIHFLANASSLASSGSDTVQMARALELPPGDFDLYVAMSETAPRNNRTPPRRVVHQQTLTVPDFSTGLTTSSIILAKSLDDAPQQLMARQQMEQPFTIGGQKITPTFTPVFTKANELLFLFFVYNEGASPEGKPNLEVGYTLTRGAEGKPFAKMAATLFDATTLPTEFSLSAGHQILVAQGVPLTTFAPGEFTLGVTITDKTTGQSIMRTVPFTVAP